MNHEQLNNESNLRSHLMAQEQLLWSGSPRRGWALRSTDVFLIPFSILWAGFVLSFEISAIASATSFFHLLWGIPFVLVGLYITVGRFWVDAKVRARTQYGLTGDRLLISTGWPGSPSLTSLPLKSLSTITLKERRDGSGTISFSDGHRFGQLQSGFHLPGMSRLAPTEFEFIENVRSVHDQILEARNEVATRTQM